MLTPSRAATLPSGGAHNSERQWVSRRRGGATLRLAAHQRLLRDLLARLLLVLDLDLTEAQGAASALSAHFALAVGLRASGGDRASRGARDALRTARGTHTHAHAHARTRARRLRLAASPPLQTK